MTVPHYEQDRLPEIERGFGEVWDVDLATGTPRRPNGDP